MKAKIFLITLVLMLPVAIKGAESRETSSGDGVSV